MESIGSPSKFDDFFEFSKDFVIFEAGVRDVEYSRVVQDHLTQHPQSHAMVVVGKLHAKPVFDQLSGGDTSDIQRSQELLKMGIKEYIGRLGIPMRVV